MSTDDQVNPGDCGCNALIGRQADVAEQDDLVHSGFCERRRGALHILGHVEEFDVRTGGRGVHGVLGEGADDADLLATDVQHDDARQLAGQQRLCIGVEIAADDLVFDRRQILRQFFGTVVELMVASGGNVDVEVVEEIGHDCRLVVAVEQGALELVAGREQHDVLARSGGGGAAGVDGRLQPGNAAEALAVGFAFSVAGRVRAGDRFEAGVEIVEMQDPERELGLRRAGKADG